MSERAGRGVHDPTITQRGVAALLPAAGLAAELALLARIARGDAPWGILTWRPTARALVVPRSLARRASFTGAAAASMLRGWPVLVRESGGGIVPLTAGVLVVALAYASSEVKIEEAYRRLCEPLAAAIGEHGVAVTLGAVPGAFCDGAYNLVAAGRKLAGTAQRWRAGAVLAHAVILVDPELPAAIGAVDAFAGEVGVEAAALDRHVALAELVPGVALDDLARRCAARFAAAFG